MKFCIFISTISIFLLFACNNGNDKSKPTQVPAREQGKTAELSSIMQMDPRLQGADSLVFVFYKDPHGLDSLRYTRYYREFHTTDPLIIDLLQNNLANSSQRFEKVRPCRSEGKIWCFSKGEIFQTVYFSAQNQSCSFVYIIHHGQFYYSDLDGSLAKKLAELKPDAREPANEAQ